jgi:hypothetical protein
MVGGNIDPNLDDFWGVTIANNNASAFQTFFGRWYNTLLPGAGSPTILDNLATS